MKLLCLSTAEQGASVAVFDNKTLICEEYWASRQTHSRRLVAMVENLLENRVRLKLSDMDGFIAAKGPGSFTGLRIGISVVKGFAFSLSKPEAGVSSLDAIAWRFSHADLPVCVMMDAKRNQVYCAVYRFNRRGLVNKSEEMVCCPEQAVNLAGTKEALFAGSGSKVFQDRILAETEGLACFSFGSMDYVSAAALGQVAFLDDNFFDCSKNQLVPTYIRKSDAEIQFVEKKQVY